MTDINDLLAQFTQWEAHRAVLGEDDPYGRSDEWADSDTEATNLLRDLAAAVKAQLETKPADDFKITFGDGTDGDSIYSFLSQIGKGWCVGLTVNGGDQVDYELVDLTSTEVTLRTWDQQWGGGAGEPFTLPLESVDRIHVH